MRINYKIDWQALGGMDGSKSLSAKKYALLEASLKIVSQQGLHNLSVTEVAKNTGLSKPLVLYHYESKERILEDLSLFIQKMGEYFLGLYLVEESSFEQKIHDCVQGTFRWYLFNNEVSDFLALLPHLNKLSLRLKKDQENFELFQMRLWERIFLESLRYRSMEELRIAVFGVRSLVTGSLINLIHLNQRDQYRDHALRLQFNLETLLKVELPSFDF